MAKPGYYHPTKNPPPKDDPILTLPFRQWVGYAHCENCDWEGWQEDLIEGKYCPKNSEPGHPETSRPKES